MQRRPGLLNRMTQGVQDKLNTIIPEKFHVLITKTMKKMVEVVMNGAGFITGKPKSITSLAETEGLIRERIKWYKTTAATEGGVAGAGGFVLALADFPVLIGIKIKLLFDIALLYGFDTEDYKERLYLLQIFEISFCSDKHRRKVFENMQDWHLKSAALPKDMSSVDWRRFQQQYRDYIDLAKMAQLIPVIGAAVGWVANYRLVNKLGYTAMQAYRMRLEKETEIFNP